MLKEPCHLFSVLCYLSIECICTDAPNIIYSTVYVNYTSRFAFVYSYVQLEMGFQDALCSTITAPFKLLYKTSAGTASYTLGAVSSATNYMGLNPSKEIKMTPPVPLWKLAAATGPYVKLAAFSGAAAVILGAVGSHKQYTKDEVGKEHRRIFETANRYHFIHTLALLGLPLCRFPVMVSTLMCSGILLFCGSCYYTAFTGNHRFSMTTPIGGFFFILAWCCLFF